MNILDISENANSRRAIGVSRLFPTIVFQRINNNVAHETRRNPKVVELCSSKSKTMPHTESTKKQVIGNIRQNITQHTANHMQHKAPCKILYKASTPQRQ